MVEVAFGPQGNLVTHTTVWVGRGALEPPYVLGQVKLDDGPLVFAHLRRLEQGAIVPLRVNLVVPGVAASMPSFWFEPADSS
jgi:uncharacterized OB-fold protein